MKTYNSGIYKIGNKRDKIANIDCKDEINQLNLLQFLNCNQNLFFNQSITHDYIQKLANQAERFQQPNQTYSKILPIRDEKSGMAKENEEIITVGVTDLKINLTISKLKMHSKSKGIRFDNHVIQLRSRVKQYVKHKEGR